LGKSLQWLLPNYLPYKKRVEVSNNLEVSVFPIASRVRLANDSSFGGLKGTILVIHMIAVHGEPTFCFYLVDLDGVHLRVPLWFEYQEVALVGPSHERACEC
jgi:hypothetical protein